MIIEISKRSLNIQRNYQSNINEIVSINTHITYLKNRVWFYDLYELFSAAVTFSVNVALISISEKSIFKPKYLQYLRNPILKRTSVLHQLNVLYQKTNTIPIWSNNWISWEISSPYLKDIWETPLKRIRRKTRRSSV